MTHLSFFFKFKPLILFSFFVLLCNFSYGQSSAEDKKIETEPQPQTVKPLPRFRIGAQVGYSYRLGAIDQAFTSEESKLVHNVNYGADISYYFKNNLGLGVKYWGNSAKASSKYLLVLGSSAQSINISEAIEVHYLGAFFGTRHFLMRNKYCISIDGGVGYVRYVDKINGTDTKVTGNTVAFMGEVGNDFMVTNFLAINLQLSVSIGVLRSLTASSGNIIVKEKLKRSERELLSYIGVSLGFRFYR